MKIIEKIATIGIAKINDDVEQRAVMLANKIAMLGILVSFTLFLLQGIFIAWDFVAYSSLIASLLFTIPLLLNSFGSGLFSRLFLAVYIPTAIVGASLIGKLFLADSDVDFSTQYFDYRYFMLASIVLAIVLFDSRTRRFTYVAIAYHCFILVLFDPLHNLLGIGYFQMGHRDPTYYFSNIVVLVAFVTEVIGLLILQHHINSHQESLINEIEERKKTEHSLRLANAETEIANRAKSDFFGNVSHELRTPLNGIVGFADLLGKSDLTSVQGTYVNMISQSADTLLTQIDNILDYTKMDSHKFQLSEQSINIGDLCTRQFDKFRPNALSKGLYLIQDIAPNIPEVVVGDELKLKRVLVNLISNAIKFTIQGGVKLKVEKWLDKNCCVYIRFSVSDTGIGIADSDQQKIFEAFEQGDGSSTKRYAGTGMGLAICNRLLLLMDSELQLKSSLGYGSEFYFDMKFKIPTKKERDYRKNEINHDA